MGVELEILELPRKARGYRFHDVTLERLEKLGRLLPTESDTEILQRAIVHFLATLENGEKTWGTIPSELGKTHKRPPRDAA